MSDAPGSWKPGEATIDPTKNVLDLVDAAIVRLDAQIVSATKRLDDMRMAGERHVSEIAGLRADYDEKLRQAETLRINAIRTVDVNAVNRAAEVSAQQATTLAAQVATSAETLRAQVAAAATAATTALAAALEPIQKDIADLRKTQYEQAGQKAQVSESRLNIGSIVGVLSFIMGLILFIISRVG